MDRAAINAQAFVRAALAARRDGYRPDVIVAHSGWGAGMFAKDVFPEARLRRLLRMVVPLTRRRRRLSRALEAALPPRLEAPMHERARNAPIAMDLAAADAAICPTDFQAAQFPPVFRARSRSCMTASTPTSSARRRRRDARRLGGLVAEDARVVTYATRGMEPHRGFPQFMAALPAILAADPKAVAVVAGENKVAYGGDSLRPHRLEGEGAGRERHRPARGCISSAASAAAAYLRLLQRSDAHVYLTVPFVLSWSMLEAMSTGCALVLSDTAPVREFAGTIDGILGQYGQSSGNLQRSRRNALKQNESTLRGRRAREVIEAAASQKKQFPRKEELFLELCR